MPIVNDLLFRRRSPQGVAAEHGPVTGFRLEIEGRDERSRQRSVNVLMTMTMTNAKGVRVCAGPDAYDFVQVSIRDATSHETVAQTQKRMIAGQIRLSLRVPVPAQSDERQGVVPTVTMSHWCLSQTGPALFFQPSKLRPQQTERWANQLVGLRPAGVTPPGVSALPSSNIYAPERDISFGVLSTCPRLIIVELLDCYGNLANDGTDSSATVSLKIVPDGCAPESSSSLVKAGVFGSWAVFANWQGPNQPVCGQPFFEAATWIARLSSHLKPHCSITVSDPSPRALLIRQTRRGEGDFGPSRT